MTSNIEQSAPKATPKCLSCGAITAWKVESLLLVRHFVITILLLFLFGTGLLYFFVVLMMRSGQNSRAKICPRCGSRNMWTFIYSEENATAGIEAPTGSAGGAQQ